MVRVFFFAFLIGISPSFAQTQEFNVPVLVGSEINSSVEEISPLISPDGNTMYFVRANDAKNLGGQLGGTDIWVAKKNNLNQWAQATNDVPWNNKGNNAVIGISKEGNILYLLNAYKNKNGIAFSKLLSNQWTDPQLISIPGIDKADFVGFYMNATFDVLLISKNGSDSFGQEDLYISIKDSLDRWSKPINLGPTINTSGYEISPFLSSDKNRLYFSSNGLGGYGDADIFVSTRLYDSWSVWSKPRNLGPVINSEKFDAYFSIYGDTVGYFSSNRSGGFSDVYQASVKTNPKNILKDSTDRIIRDAQQLLSDLKEVSPDFQIETLTLETPFVPSSVDRQVSRMVGKYGLKNISRIELVVYSASATEQLKKTMSDVMNSFIQSGMPKESLSADSATDAKRNATSIEVKIYLKK